MTDITPLIKSSNMVVQSYSQNGFKISGVLYYSNVIILPDRVLTWDGVSTNDLVALKGQVDVILYGTGKTSVPLTPDKKLTGLNLDVMDTGAACRAYNALLADGRRVAAALIKLTD